MADQLARSALYVPGDAPDKVAKALERGADEVIVDLEDAVAPARKEYARQVVSEWLAGLAEPASRIWVRINPGQGQRADVEAVASSGALTGLVVAKTESRADLVAVDELLTELGSAAVLVPLLESAGAVLAAAEISAGPRVKRLQTGEADLRADIGVTPGRDERELLYTRSHVVLTSRAAGVDPPMAPVSTEFRDVAAFRASTEALARLGFFGRACIHPAQVVVANEVFTPDPDEVAWARGVISTLDSSAAGVSVDSRGQMIDEAVVRQARRVLSLTGDDLQPQGGSA